MTALAAPRYSLAQKAFAECLGTALLLCAVIGSGIMAQRLCGGNMGLALLANTLATVWALYVLIEVLGPVSGAHFNPLVTLIFIKNQALGHTGIAQVATVFIAAQLTGAVLGAGLAHAMFDLPLLQTSSHLRGGWGQWLAEAVATAALVLVIARSGAAGVQAKASALVACTIGAAYWFTASTSFANPAAVLGRMLTDSFTGIAPASAPGFVAAQCVGAAAGWALSQLLYLLWIPFKPMSRLRTLPHPTDLPALQAQFAQYPPGVNLAQSLDPTGHAPRILLLYGSLRPRSFSRLAVEEAARLLQFFGAETRIFDPCDLPLPDQTAGDDHPAVTELRALSLWSEGQVWCSPERHGAITAVMKAQIDHLPLSMGALRPTQGRTLAVMQVSGGSQSFNAVNTLRLLGRWMRMVTIPNQSSVAMAYKEFEGSGPMQDRMRASSYYDRIVDTMEELVRFTVLLRGQTAMLTDRYSERVEAQLKAGRAAAVQAAALASGAVKE